MEVKAKTRIGKKQRIIGKFKKKKVIFNKRYCKT